LPYSDLLKIGRLVSFGVLVRLDSKNAVEMAWLFAKAIAWK